MEQTKHTTTAPRLTIDLNALASNWSALQKLSGQAECSAVIKADAYGLTIEPVAKALAKAGCTTFFVAMVEEGIRVRKLLPDATIFVLNGILKETTQAVIENNLCPVLSSIDQIGMWMDAKSGIENTPGCAIHIDTGMNRLGLSLAEAEGLGNKPELVSRIGPSLIMSHLACADYPEHELNALQLERFTKIASLFPGVPASLANTAAILSGKKYHFNLTRPGIGIYGGEAINLLPNPMQTVVTAEARILQIRHARAGESVGYGASKILDRDTRIAIVSGGYADGFHRAGSGSGVALRTTDVIAGHGAIGDILVPILGRVSMDLTAFDVTDVPEATLSDAEWIELFGKNLPLDDAARACGTIGYELLTGLGHRYQRTYLGEAE